MSPAENQLFQWHILPPSSGSCKQETSVNLVANKTLQETSIKQVAPASHWSCVPCSSTLRAEATLTSETLDDFQRTPKIELCTVTTSLTSNSTSYIFYLARCNCSIYYIHRYSRFDGQLWVFKPHKNYSCLKNEICMTCLVKKMKVIWLSMHLILHRNCISTS
jgi:hypothetical protein